MSYLHYLCLFVYCVFFFFISSSCVPYMYVASFSGLSMYDSIDCPLRRYSLTFGIDN
jgi:hypothetical protein